MSPAHLSRVGALLAGGGGLPPLSKIETVIFGCGDGAAGLPRYPDIIAHRGFFFFEGYNGLVTKRERDIPVHPAYYHTRNFKVFSKGDRYFRSLGFSPSI